MTANFLPLMALYFILGFHLDFHAVGVISEIMQFEGGGGDERMFALSHQRLKLFMHLNGNGGPSEIKLAKKN